VDVKPAGRAQAVMCDGWRGVWRGAVGCLKRACGSWLSERSRRAASASPHAANGAPRHAHGAACHKGMCICKAMEGKGDRGERIIQDCTV
jgi:hypothetical protein